MQRLIHGKGLNSDKEYDKIYFQREKKGVDSFDQKRWKKLVKFYQGGRFIDLGCLDSLAPVFVKEKNPEAEVWGIDVATEALEEMKKKYPFVYYEVGDVYKTRFPKNYFNYAVAGELIEHLEEPERFLKEAFRILKTNGILALSTPLEEARDKGACDIERHVWSFTEEDIIEMLEPYGEVWIRKMGSTYFPRYQYHFPVILGYCKKK